jgi:hypothetical protein
VSIYLKCALAIIGILTVDFVVNVGPCDAVEALRVYRGVLILEGKIEPGDYFSVRNFLRKKSNFDKISGGVFLASPGGYVGEAIKIGYLVRALQLHTDAPSGPPTDRTKFGESLITPKELVDPKRNYLCASSCFFVYIAGIYRNLNRVGRLGLHRPVRLQSDLNSVADNEAKFADTRIHATVKRYLNEMDVPEKYLELMFSVPPDEMRWITQEEFDSDFKGYIPRLRDLINAKCDPHVSDESRMTDKTKCRNEVEQPSEAWKKLFLDQ